MCANPLKRKARRRKDPVGDLDCSCGSRPPNKAAALKPSNVSAKINNKGAAAWVPVADKPAPGGEPREEVQAVRPAA